jgi:hypothetical protein
MPDTRFASISQVPADQRGLNGLRLKTSTGVKGPRGFRNRECGDPAESIHSGQSETELRCGGSSPKADSGNDRLMARVLRLPRRPPELRKKGREDARNRAPLGRQVRSAPALTRARAKVRCRVAHTAAALARSEARPSFSMTSWLGLCQALVTEPRCSL